MSNSTIKNGLLNQVLVNFEKFEAQLNGTTGNIHGTRKEALETLKTQGFPDTRNEEYKYTNITKALEKKFSFQEEPTTLSLKKEEIEDRFIKGLDAHRLVFINGEFSRDYSDFSEDAGLEIIDLPTAIRSGHEALTAHFGKYADYGKDAFIALNTSLAKNGTFIQVSANKVIDRPICIYYINDTSSNQTYNYARNLILGGENSQATILEVHSDLGAHESFSNVVSEIVVKQRARISHFILQSEQEKGYHVGTTQVVQEKDSYFANYAFTTSGEMIRNNLNIDLIAERCETHMYGLYLLNGKAHVDNHTTVDHQQPNSFSNELYKGIIEDRSRGVFNGKIYVRQAAQKTNAFQSNKNILLSDTAVVNTKPQLEIWADDVKCSHGCTTGQLDEDAMFYLRARGLSKDSARALLLYAFATEVVENVTIQPVKDYLESVISTRLHKDF
ncbi:Fe-S cluster assembly protein SufD [Fulvivirga sp. M361]|uniref:Fe-S cluster assembly protein SufD n=1 Tax=Fulvivirga sp. M361 TaxID=2594266 RepID=UPI0011798BC5|nr:Fe-S cluster assembly protein SufD [Fulvivirga sp. M361]TRX52428.1 Fe-S cluster assembly protein SufD [Fulvivirga sp. M361]